MYEGFFGLQQRPFDLVPNPRFLFLSDVHQEALSTLRYGLTGPGGITLLLGEAGTGKTTLVQAALSVGDDRVQCVLISNPTLTRAEFYEGLVSGFGLSAEAAHSKTAFLSEIQAHALARLREGKSTALMLDEAQSLPQELLEEVRLLSNLETETTKLLSVVLAGQPELAERLNQDQLRHLKQRVSLRCTLRPFNIAETASYVAGRLRKAGGTPAEIFTRDAIAVVFEASAGIPRVINVICENALIGGFANQVKPVTQAIVTEVVRDFDLKSSGRAAVPSKATPEMPPSPSMTPSDEGRTSELVSSSPEKSRQRPMFRFFGNKKRSSFF
jgi:general secretion pathway protein A